MPGPPNSRDGWGELPLVVDTSAWARAHHQPVRKRWRQALLEDRLRISPAVRLEILLTARNGAAFDDLAEELSALVDAPLTPTVMRAAQSAMRALAHRSAGAQRLPVVDYLLAAAAQEISAAVLHYDRDFDTLSNVLAFESVWLATPGSLP
jgi:predicted nucleic acid-binding protein